MQVYFLYQNGNHKKKCLTDTTVFEQNKTESTKKKKFDFRF